jgi:hypothetical protein
MTISMRPWIAALFIAAHSAAAAQTRPVVEPSRVGTVAIGATAESIYQEFGDRARLVDLKLEGHLSPALELRMATVQLAPSIVAEIQSAASQLVITRIHVIDPSFRTKEGIGVGSTYGELRSTYRVDWVAVGEGEFIARVERLGISFVLDVSGRRSLLSIRDPAAVPPAVRVVGMMLTR